MNFLKGAGFHINKNTFYFWMPFKKLKVTLHKILLKKHHKTVVRNSQKVKAIKTIETPQRQYKISRSTS